MPAEKVALETSGAKIIDNTLWFIKYDSNNTNGSLCKYVDGSLEILDTNIYSFVAHGNNDILVHKKFSSHTAEETVDLSYCDGDTTKEVSTNVDAKQIIFNKNGIAFIRNPKENGGELCNYKKGKLNVIDSNVYSILDY